jgi:hypothetical protein
VISFAGLIRVFVRDRTAWRQSLFNPRPDRLLSSKELDLFLHQILRVPKKRKNESK